MTKKCFQSLSANIIEQYIKDLLKIDKESGNDCLKYRKNKLNKVYKIYEKERRTIRKYFMNSESQPIDRHKIGSVLIYSILKSHIFKVTKIAKQHLLPVLLMANEYLAIYVALSVVESYITEENNLEANNSKKVKQLEIPMTFHNNDSNAYIDNLCQALYYLRNNKEFDVFAYANILFLLEAYTKKNR